MPHFHIEYSANLEEIVDVAAFCEAIRAEAVQINAFPTAGVRVRAIRVDHYAIADGDPKHGFVDLTIRLRKGRPAAVKKDAVERIFAVAESFLASVMAQHSIALSAEMRDIDPQFAPKTGTIRDHLGDTA